ncbi:hypothetical protein LTR66_015403, partial [Elasticomyces elasticus]
SNRDEYYANFTRAHRTALDFLRSVDEAALLDEANSLGSVFWATAFAGVQNALKLGLDYDDYCMVFPILNKNVPKLESELKKYGDDGDVQEPLRKIFQEYTVQYMFAVKYFGRDDLDDYDFETIGARSAQAHPIYVQCTQEWLAALKLVPAKIAEKLKSITIEEPTEEDDGYTLIRYLGKGAYGAVHSVKARDDGQFYARKTIPKTDEAQDELTIQRSMLLTNSVQAQSQCTTSSR